jgi:hypothetical protein
MHWSATTLHATAPAPHAIETQNTLPLFIRIRIETHHTRTVRRVLAFRRERGSRSRRARRRAVREYTRDASRTPGQSPSARNRTTQHRQKNPTHRSRHPSTSRIDRRLGRPHPRGAAHDDPSIHPSIRIDVCIVCVVYPLARPRVGPSLASHAIIISSSTHRRTYLVFAYIVVATCVVEK